MPREQKNSKLGIEEKQRQLTHGSGDGDIRRNAVFVLIQTSNLFCKK